MGGRLYIYSGLLGVRVFLVAIVEDEVHEWINGDVPDELLDEFQVKWSSALDGKKLHLFSAPGSQQCVYGT